MTRRAASPLGVPSLSPSKTQRGWNVIRNPGLCLLFRSTCAGVLHTTNIGVPPKLNSQYGSSVSAGISAAAEPPS